MKFSEYQALASQTAVYPGKQDFTGLSYAALGLNGEAGEVAEKVKKLWRDNGVLDDATRQALSKELGDVLWYVSAVSEEINIPLAEIAAANIEKLRSRRERNTLAGSGDDR